MSQPLRRVSRAAAVVRRTATVLVMVFAAACGNDRTTAPALRTPPSAAVHGTYTTLGTYSIPIPPNNTFGGAQPVANTGILVPAGTYYRVRVDGTVTVSANPEYVQAYGTPWDKMGTFGPFGTIDGELVVQLKARNTDGSGANPISFVNPQYNIGSSAPDSARSDVVYASKAIEVQAGRSGIGGVTSDNCCHWSIGMFALTASQTVTVEQVTDVAHVVANPVAVHPNTQVTFTASRDDGGNLIVYNWHWQPDAGQPGNATNLCGGGNPCQMTVAGSGTMLVYTNVGNPTAHVTVYQATSDTSFKLAADRSTVPYRDTATFTPLYNGVPGPAARWHWAALDTSTHDTTACAPGISPCKKLMLTTGTMWVYTSTTPGQGDSASAPVTVQPPRIHVACDPETVIRTTSVACTAQASGALAVSGWTFTADDAAVGTVSGPSTSPLKWEGMAVAPGVVTAQGTVDGVAATSDTARIIMTARTGTGWNSHGDTLAVRDDSGSFECHIEPHYAATVAGWAGPPGCVGDYAFTPHAIPQDSAVTVRQVPAGGPNAGLWYVSVLNARLEFHAQVLKDYRPDGNKYTFASDSVTKVACQTALGTATSGSVSQVNLSCNHNPDFTSFYNKLWRHEGCHARLAFIKFEDVPDPFGPTEPLVARDSGGLVNAAFYVPNGLFDTSGQVLEFSDAIDVMGDTKYTIWLFNPNATPQAWLRDTTFIAHDYIINDWC